MANTTYFLDKIASPMSLGTAPMVISNTVNFAEQNVASGSTFDVLKIPKNTILVAAGICVDDAPTNATATVTLGQDGDSGNDNIFSATTVGSTDSVLIAFVQGAGSVANTIAYLSTETTVMKATYFTAADVLRSAVGTANLTDGTLTFFAVVIPVPSQR